MTTQIRTGRGQAPTVAAVHRRSLESVLAEVAVREAPHGIRIIGIDGRSGSGKSTLAAKLSEVSGAPVIEVDDFVSWNDCAGWWPRFEDEVLRPLLAGDAAHFRVRDWQGDEFGTSLNGYKTVPWAPLVIIEGVTCTRRSAAGLLTYRIWVQAPEDLRLGRGIQRDGESHRGLWQRWMREEATFFAEDGTQGRADLVVDGDPGVDHDANDHVVVIDG